MSRCPFRQIWNKTTLLSKKTENSQARLLIWPCTFRVTSFPSWWKLTCIAIKLWQIDKSIFYLIPVCNKKRFSFIHFTANKSFSNVSNQVSNVPRIKFSNFQVSNKKVCKFQETNISNVLQQRISGPNLGKNVPFSTNRSFFKIFFIVPFVYL